ncbi:MAG TPA: hypothetical protein VGA85_03970 [Dehalococcoidales bacterium]
MPDKIRILSPNVTDENEYLQVAARLGELSALMMYGGRDSMSEREWKEASVYLTARRVYDEFYQFARRHNRAMYMTLEEIKSELPSYADLDDGIKYLLDKGLIKEEFREVP